MLQITGEHGDKVSGAVVISYSLYTMLHINVGMETWF